MDFKQQMSKFGWKNGKDKWLILLLVGTGLLILSYPSEQKTLKSELPGTSESVAQASAGTAKTYETQMEERVKEILSHVEGVGAVDVMIVLKSSEEKVVRVDTNTSVSATQETDSNGGNRKVESKEVSENTILAGSGDTGGPVIEKELKPEISGVVISAAGGGSPKVKAEISEAMEALFDIPVHKIKVLKRVE